MPVTVRKVGGHRSANTTTTAEAATTTAASTRTNSPAKKTTTHQLEEDKETSADEEEKVGQVVTTNVNEDDSSGSDSDDPYVQQPPEKIHQVQTPGSPEAHSSKKKKVKHTPTKKTPTKKSRPHISSDDDEVEADEGEEATTKHKRQKSTSKMVDSHEEEEEDEVVKPTKPSSKPSKSNSTAAPVTPTKSSNATPKTTPKKRLLHPPSTKSDDEDANDSDKGNRPIERVQSPIKANKKLLSTSPAKSSTKSTSKPSSTPIEIDEDEPVVTHQSPPHRKRKSATANAGDEEEVKNETDSVKGGDQGHKKPKKSHPSSTAPHEEKTSTTAMEENDSDDVTMEDATNVPTATEAVDDLEFDDASPEPHAAVDSVTAASVKTSPRMESEPTIDELMEEGESKEDDEASKEFDESFKYNYELMQFHSYDLNEQHRGLDEMERLFGDQPPEISADPDLRQSLNKNRKLVVEFFVHAIQNEILFEETAKRGLRFIQNKVIGQQVSLVPSHYQAELLIRLIDWTCSDPTDTDRSPAGTKQCKPALLLTFIFHLLRVLLSHEEMIDHGLSELNHKRPVTNKLFLEYVIKRFCDDSRSWRSGFATTILTELFDFNLTASLKNIIIRYAAQVCVPHLHIHDFESFTHHLLVLSSEGSGEAILSAIVQRMSDFENEIETQEMQQRLTQSASLSQGPVPLSDVNPLAFQWLLKQLFNDFEQAVQYDLPLGEKLIGLLESDTLPSICTVGMALQIMKHSAKWEKRVWKLLNTCILNSFTRSGPSDSANRLIAIIFRLIQLKDVNPQLLHNIMQLGFHFMDEGSVHSRPSTTTNVATTISHEETSRLTHLPTDEIRLINEYDQLIIACKKILIHLCQTHATVGRELVSALLTRIQNTHDHGADFIATELLTELIQNPKTRQTILDQSEQIKSSLEWFQCFSIESGQRFLRALEKLLVYDISLRDFTIRTVHKLAFATNITSRVLAVEAYLFLCQLPPPADSAIRRSYTMAAPSSSPLYPATPANGNGANKEIDPEFFLKCKDMFKRALTYECQVRRHVYHGLLRLFESHESVRPFIMDLLYSQLRQYFPAGEHHQQHLAIQPKNPLRVEKTIDSSSGAPAIREPLQLLIQTIQQMLAIQEEHMEIPSVKSGQREFSQEEIAAMDADISSTAMIKLQLDQLLDRLLRITSLTQLTIDSSIIQNATIDDVGGVQQVLQADVMHGVLLTCLEWYLTSHLKAKDVGGLTVQCLSGPHCLEFIKLFELFWQLHSLLTTSAPKPQTAKKKSKSSKKKKKKDSSDDEEDEEEDEEEEEKDEAGEEEEDEDEEDDGEERKSSAVKKRKSAAAKSSSSTTKPGKPKGKAIHQLVLSGFSLSTIDRLIHLSTINYGEMIHPSSNRAASDFTPTSPHRPMLVVTPNAANSPATSVDLVAKGPVSEYLLHHTNLQRFLMISLRSSMEQLLNQSHAADTACQQIRPFASILLDRLRVAVNELKQQAEAAKLATEDKKKPKKDRTESMLSIIESIILIGFRLCAKSGKVDNYSQFLMGMLSQDKHDKVKNPDGSPSWPKLIHWIFGHFEKDVYVLVSVDPEKLTPHYAEANLLMEILLELWKTIPNPNYSIGKYQDQIMRKRVEFTNSIHSRPIHVNGVGASHLLQLSYQCCRGATLMTNENAPIYLTTQQFMTCVLDSLLLNQGLTPAVERPLPCVVDELNFKSCLAWFLNELKSVFLLIDQDLKNLRFKLKDEGVKMEVSPSKTAEVIATNLLSVCCYLINLVHLDIVGVQRDSVFRQVHRYYKQLTAVTITMKQLYQTQKKGCSKFKELVRLTGSGLRPAIDELITSYEQRPSGEEKPVKSKRAGEKKAGVNTIKNDKDSGLIREFIGVCEKFETTIRGFDTVCKTDLAASIPKENKTSTYVFAEGPRSIKSESARSSIITHRSPVIITSTAAAASKASTVAHSQSTPKSRPILSPAAKRRKTQPSNETKLAPKRTTVPITNLVAHASSPPDAQEIEDDDEVPVKDEIEEED